MDVKRCMFSCGYELSTGGMVVFAFWLEIGLAEPSGGSGAVSHGECDGVWGKVPFEDINPRPYDASQELEKSDVCTILERFGDDPPPSSAGS